MVEQQKVDIAEETTTIKTGAATSKKEATRPNSTSEKENEEKEQDNAAGAETKELNK